MTGAARRRGAQQHFGCVEFFSPWVLRRTHPFRLTPGMERTTTHRDGKELRRSDAPLALWMGMLKGQEERDRNKRLIRMAEEAQRDLHTDVPDAAQELGDCTVCWPRATVVIARRHIAPLRCDDMATVCHDSCWDSQVFYCDPETMRANVLVALAEGLPAGRPGAVRPRTVRPRALEGRRLERAAQGPGRPR